MPLTLGYAHLVPVDYRVWFLHNLSSYEDDRIGLVKLCLTYKYLESCISFKNTFCYKKHTFVPSKVSL